MILSSTAITNSLGKQIIINPFNPNNLNPNSYNLTLHNELCIYENDVLDVSIPNSTKTIEIPREGYILQPGELYLARTVEYTETHGFVPLIQGRSSLGRLGITVHISAGFGDVGYSGHWTLQLTCIRPIKIFPGIKICQIYYQTLLGDTKEYSSNKYQHSKSILASKIYEEFSSGK